MSRKYPEEIKTFIAENAWGRTSQELADLVNEVFPDFGVTVTQVRCYKTNNGIKCGVKGVREGHGSKYTPEMLEWVRANAAGKGNQELADECSRVFGIEISAKQISNYKKSHKISSGLTGHFEKGCVPYNKGKHIEVHPNCKKGWFKKGEHPQNFKEIGTVVVNNDGFLVRKVANPDVWKFESRLVWEAHYGPIPPGNKIMHLDGNRLNVDINNLAMISDAEHMDMVRRKSYSDNPEITRAGVAIAKLSVATRARKKTKQVNENG